MIIASIRKQECSSSQLVAASWTHQGFPPIDDSYITSSANRFTVTAASNSVIMSSPTGQNFLTVTFNAWTTSVCVSLHQVMGESCVRIWYSIFTHSVAISQLSIPKTTSSLSYTWIIANASSAGHNNCSGVPSQPDNQCSCPNTQLGHRCWSHLHPQQDQEISATGRTVVKLVRGSSDALKLSHVLNRRDTCITKACVTVVLLVVKLPTCT